MPPSRKKRKGAPPVTATDHISPLPDHMLHHLLSFLPVQAAVRTCVLTRRWRHLWRSTTGLRIVRLDGDDDFEVKDLRKFMDHLIALRERTHLDTVEIKFDQFDADDVPYVNLWTRFAVMCKVRALTLHILEDGYLHLDNLPLVSQHLVTLDLDCVALPKAFLDFASCPALKDLKMNDCDINADRISSLSPKHLSITCCISDSDCRVRVSAPGLVSLKLEGFIGMTPFLEDMALLEAACVNLGNRCKDVCLNYDSGVFCGANVNTCKNCAPISDDCSNNCVLLGGISSAKHLKLMSEIGKFIFTRDLKHCPAFSKLKTLVLNEAPDMDPLACILKNSPVLEKLTLQLFSEGPNHEVEMEGSYCCMERPSAISEHLNIVEVKCNVVDKRILKILRIQFLVKARFGLAVDMTSLDYSEMQGLSIICCDSVSIFSCVCVCIICQLYSEGGCLVRSIQPMNFIPPSCLWDLVLFYPAIPITLLVHAEFIQLLYWSVLL